MEAQGFSPATFGNTMKGFSPGFLAADSREKIVRHDRTLPFGQISRSGEFAFHPAAQHGRRKEQEL